MQRMRGGKPPGTIADKYSREAFHDVRKLSAEDPLAGAVINDRYEMIGRVGSGGMAKIYLAMDRQTKTRVAVKIIGDNPERMDEMTERFFVEARAAGMINHPNIIGIRDIGTYKDKIFCVMEFLDGFPLSVMLENRGGMPWERARSILAQVCDALEAAHSKGVIHRDMKPENVMLVPHGNEETAKVLDFGLAKLTDSKERLTRENMVLGTPSYMAPEQAWASEYDHRVDIYSLGVMAYELACGTVPFSSDIPDEKARVLQVLLMHKETAPQSMRERKPGLDIPIEAEAAIMRALEKDPAKRFASAREMKEALLGKHAGTRDGMPDEPAHSQESEAEAEEYGTRRRLALPPEEETIGRILGRTAKRLLLIGTVAAAIGAPAYYFRSEISGIIGPARRTSSGGEQPAPRLETRQAAPLQTSYGARVESSPRGASVSDISGGEAQGRILGITPLDLTFQNYENVLLVEKPGYYPKRIVVTRSQPEWRVSLRRVQRQSSPAQDEGADSGGAAPEGSEGSGDHP